MTYRKTCGLGIAVMAATLAMMGTIGTAQAAASADSTITIGWTSWADAKFMINLVQQQIQKRTQHKVNMKMMAIGVQYEGVAKGEIDAMVMGWFPNTHASYWKKVHGKVVDLGPMYNDAKLGWAVPDYVPKSQLNSIADLKKSSVKSKLGGTIQGIDPGAGLMQLSQKTMPEYGLKQDGYHLQAASGPAMTAALARAEKQHKWIVVTLWTPHWAWGKWKLRFLKDPKHTLGGPQHIDAVARKGFTKDYPKVAKFLSSLHIPLDQLQEAMYNARKTSEKQAVSKFVSSHKALVNSWWFGTGVKGSGGGADAAMPSS